MTHPTKSTQSVYCVWPHLPQHSPFTLLQRIRLFSALSYFLLRNFPTQSIGDIKSEYIADHDNTVVEERWLIHAQYAHYFPSMAGVPAVTVANVATHSISANKPIVYFWFEGSLRKTHSVLKKSNADFE